MQEENIVRVNIKWNSQLFKDLPLDKGAPLIKFKTLVNELTHVPINSQKIICKGTVWKEDQDLSKLQIAQGQQLLLYGAKEDTQIQLSKEKVKFEEELTPEQKAALLKDRSGIVLPTGLVNLGNTCYMNSSIQILRKVHELKDFILSTEPKGGQQNGQFFFALKDLLKKLESKGQSFQPLAFLQVLFAFFPAFAQRESANSYKQQDADECFQNIIQTIEPLTICENEEGVQRNLIKELFEIEFTATLKNADIETEVSVKQEKFKKLMCIIDNQSHPVNTLIEGITASLEEKLEKTSEVDNNIHIFNKQLKISKLPSYLLVQMVRFYWKQGVQGKEGVKAKILRNVGFPKILDLFDFCTPQLQEQLQVGRDYEKKKLLEYQAHEQDELEKYKKELEEKGQQIPDDTREIYKRFKTKQAEKELQEHDNQLYRKHGFGLVTGNYQLIGVLTHQGREADSGHYMAWVHKSGEDWLCYNDDQVSEVKTEKILDLRGGGDWHMGYYLLYRKLEVE